MIVEQINCCYDSDVVLSRRIRYINLTEVTNWTGGQSTGSFSSFDGINFPDTMMDGVARYTPPLIIIIL